MRIAFALVIVSGCSYPEFQFAGAADAAIDSGEAEETSVADTDVAIDSSIDDTPVADTSVIDAPADSALVDSAKSDSLADTKDAATPVGCSGVKALFCDDFDSSSTAAEKWTFAYEQGTGKVSLITSGAYSSPKAMVSELPASSAAITAATIGKTITASTSAAVTRLDARMYIETASYAGADVSFYKIQRSGGHGVGLIRTASGYEVEVFGTTYQRYPMPAIPSGKWVHVRLDATLRVTGGSYRIYIDDMTTPVKQGDALSTVDVEGVDRDAVIGSYNETMSAPLRIRFDDVIIDFP